LRAYHGPRRPTTPITRVGFGATAKRAKHEAPRHSHFQLGGQFRSLVRTLCVYQGIQWSWVECRNFYSKWQPHLIFIYIYATAILHFITAHTSGHNSGPDAVARKQCQTRVLAMLGRALAVGPDGPVPPRAPQRPRQVQASQVRPCTCGQGAVNSDPVVRLACRFVQCTSREWTASALSRLGRRLAHSRGKEAPTSSDS
jgi:hypothetical protein